MTKELMFEPFDEIPEEIDGCICTYTIENTYSNGKKFILLIGGDGFGNSISFMTIKDKLIKLEMDYSNR